MVGLFDDVKVQLEDFSLFIHDYARLILWPTQRQGGCKY